MGPFGSMFTGSRSLRVVLLFTACGAVVGFLAPYDVSRFAGVVVGVAWFDFWYAVFWLGYRFYLFVHRSGN